jgi:hypothetical protein
MASYTVDRTPPTVPLPTGGLMKPSTGSPDSGVLIVRHLRGQRGLVRPSVMADDRRLLTGAVSSSCVVTLNFAASGKISKVTVRLDQTVRKRLLAGLTV